VKAPNPSPSLADLAAELRFRLEALRALGWRPGLRLRPHAEVAPVRVLAPRPAAPASAGASGERERRQAALAALAAEVRECRQCALCESRQRTVFGVGDPCARLMLVGEAPGAEEDRLGEPFVGRAGQLLDDMLAAMGLDRGRVYIANIVKCRPPQNRQPEPREALSCLPFLRRQIAVVAPELICALGATAAKTLLGTPAPIGRLRGRFHDFDGIPLMPTFHPAHLLRAPEDKRLAWADLKQILAHLGLSPPARPAPQLRD
jgi:DNA polymerase